MLKRYTWEENPDGTRYFTVCVFFQVAATIAVILRAYSRNVTNQKLQTNDYAIFASLILSVANMVVLALSIVAGLGLHANVLPPENIVLFLKLQITISVIWAWNLFTIKVAILDIYMKVFRPETHFVYVCRAFLVIQCIWVIAAMLQNLLWCIPLEFVWDKTIPGGKCSDLLMSYYSGHIIILIMDFFLAVLPIPVLWKLRMDTRKKMGITVMFSIGMVIGAFDLMRIVWREKIGNPDITYEYALLYCFTLLEAQFGIIIACIPLMQPVFRRMVTSDFMSGVRSKLSTGEGNSKAYASHPSILSAGSRGGSKIHSQKRVRNTDKSFNPLGEEDTVRIYAMNDIEAHEDSRGIEVRQEWDVRR